MAKTVKNFSSGGAYKKWLAYGHIHGNFAKSPGNTPVKIKGQSHSVIHAKAGTRKSNHPSYKK